MGTTRMADSGGSATSEQEADSTTIQWNDSAAVAARRLRQGTLSSLTVVADGRPIGQVRLADIERCEDNGNWLDAVLVQDLVRPPRDTCN
jgi:hypothetical protein